MKINLFGLKLGGGNKPLLPADEKKPRQSFVPPEKNDDAISVEAAGGFFGQYIDLDGTVRNDAELIYKYREMSMHTECESAIDDIICESVVTEENFAPIKLVMDELKEVDDKTKKKISEEFQNILELLHFNTKGYEIFRRWYVDGRLVYHIIVDEAKKSDGILELRYVDPVNIQKVRQYQKKQMSDGSGARLITDYVEFYIYNRAGFKGGNQEGIRISPDAVASVNSGLYDSRNKRTVGYLHKAIKPLNQVRMMEDAVVIYRLSRAPERRIFYVDVGNLPKNKAEQYMKELMNRHRNKLVYDATTGEMGDSRRHLSMMEDYWMPRRDGGKGTEIDTLPGAQNLSELEDVIYFLQKLYKSLNVPISRINNEQKSFSIGKTTEITRDEIKFSKFITRLRNKFSELFTDLLKTQLILKGIVTIDEWEAIKNKIFFNYLKDSYFAEIKQNEITSNRMNVLAEAEPYLGRFYSDLWVRKNILNLTDEEIEIMDKQMKKEKKEKEKELLDQIAAGLMPDPNDPNGMGMGGGMGGGMGMPGGNQDVGGQGMPALPPAKEPDKTKAFEPPKPKKKEKPKL